MMKYDTQVPPVLIPRWAPPDPQILSPSRGDPPFAALNAPIRFAQPIQETERELSYFSPVERISQVDELGNVNVKYITEYRLDRQKVERLLFSELGVEVGRTAQIDPSSKLRIRSVFDNGSIRYYFQIKSEKREVAGIPVESDEQTIEISRDQFMVIPTEASEGATYRRRYVAVGQAGTGSSTSRVRLNADIFIAAGPVSKQGFIPPIPQGGLPGFFFELEVERSGDIQLLRDGQHHFASLQKGALLISEQAPAVKALLSKSSLAKRGVDDRRIAEMQRLVQRIGQN